MSIALGLKKNILSPISPSEIMGHYVTSVIGASFRPTSPKFHAAMNVWWALIQYQAANGKLSNGIGRVELNARTGQVIPLDENDIRIIHEKAAIVDAKARDELPLGANGYVLREYARQKANQFLWNNLGMYYSAFDPLLRDDEKSPIWEFAITFKMYDLAPIFAGKINVDATTGIPTPLNTEMICRIKEDVNATLRSQTSAAEKV